MKERLVRTARAFGTRKKNIWFIAGKRLVREKETNGAKAWQSPAIAGDIYLDLLEALKNQDVLIGGGVYAETGDGKGVFAQLIGIGGY